MNIRSDRLFGAYPILATPFTDGGEVDLESLRALVRFLLKAKVHGIGMLGMASEAYALLDSEKDAIVKVVMEEAHGKVPIIVGTSHPSAVGAVELGRRAEKDGAAALMVMAPYVAKPDGIRLYEFFARVAASVSIPIMIQDAPNASGVNIPAALVARLAKEFQNVQYIKVEAPPTHIKISEVLDATNGDITVFGGMNAVFMYEEFQRGSVGTMPACEFPGVAVRIFEAYRAEQFDEARRLFVKHLPLFRMGTIPNFALAVHKEILFRLGVIKSPAVRNPNATLDARLKADVELLLSELDQSDAI